MARTRTQTSAAAISTNSAAKKSRRDYPAHALKEALVLIEAIGTKNAGKPMDRLLLADAIGRKPSSSDYRVLLSSSLKYGLTSGTEKADYIEPTELGSRIINPTSTADVKKAQIDAVMRVPLFERVLTHYNRAKLPEGDFFANTLEREFKIDSQHKHEAARMVRENAEFIGVLQNISGSDYIRFDLNKPDPSIADDVGADIDNSSDGDGDSEHAAANRTIEVKSSHANPPSGTGVIKRVFITHGKNKAFVEPLKKLLKYGELDAVVAAESQSVSQPVPDKVLKAMRSCGAAVIHVEDELVLHDGDGNEQVVLNPNVLIEIGAAMALFDRRFILLVKNGIALPSNLQGLYEVRYDGRNLDSEATIKLLEAINDIKNHPLPAYAEVGATSSV